MPDKYVPAVKELATELACPVKVAVIVPAEKLPEASRATMVEAVLALVALEVTVNVAPVAWLAVKVCEPDRPVPDVFIVSVALLTVGRSEVNAKVPVVAGSVRTVPVPATALGVIWAEPDVAPGSVTLEMPVSAWLAEVLFSATAVVPT